MIQFSISLLTGLDSLGVKLSVAASTAMGSGTRFLGRHRLLRFTKAIDRIEHSGLGYKRQDGG